MANNRQRDIEIADRTRQFLGRIVVVDVVETIRYLRQRNALLLDGGAVVTDIERREGGVSHGDEPP